MDPTTANSEALINAPANLNTNNALNTVNTANTNRGNILNAANMNVNNVNSAPNINTTAPAVNKVPDPVVVEPNVVIQATADKSLYYSNERITLAITLMSNQDLSGIVVRASGIESRWGDRYVDLTKTIQVTKNQPTNFNFIAMLPACSSCSGIVPGDYNIDVTAMHEEKILATDQITINLQQ